MRRVSGLQKAGEARRESRTDRHRQSIAGHPGCVNPGPPGLHGKIIDQEARFKIVGAIEDKVATGKKFRGILGPKIGHNTLHLDAGIDRAQLLFGGHGFGQGIAGVGLVEQHLALEIGGFDEVPVNDLDGAHSRANQQIAGGCPNGSAADNRRP